MSNIEPTTSATTEPTTSATTEPTTSATTESTADTLARANMTVAPAAEVPVAPAAEAPITEAPAAPAAEAPITEAPAAPAAPAAEAPVAEAPVAEVPALYSTDENGYIRHKGEHIGYVGTMNNPEALVSVSKTGKTIVRNTALSQAFAPKTLLVATGYERTRRLCLNGRYTEFFADVARLMSTQDKAVLFNNPSALAAFSSTPNKSGALALLQFCISRWSGIKNAEKAAFAALCAEILAALTK